MTGQNTVPAHFCQYICMYSMLCEPCAKSEYINTTESKAGKLATDMAERVGFEPRRRIASTQVIDSSCRSSRWSRRYRRSRVQFRYSSTRGSEMKRGRKTSNDSR